MTAYIVRRLLLMIPTLFGIMLISFTVVQFAPGGPIERIIAQLSGADTGGSSRVSGPASDFGAQGTPPSHPELLDWLAVELAESGWDLKNLHRLMVTSAAYCQDSTIDARNPLHARGLAVDRDNSLL